jgi:GPH family glycoside/pentoside/hexuronide:cation symporter
VTASQADLGLSAHAVGEAQGSMHQAPDGTGTAAGSVTVTGLAGYGAIAFPLAFAGLPIYLHAPDFYAVTMAQSVAALGSVLLVLRLVDALQDPLIGSLSDRFHDRRAAIIGAGVLLLGLGFWMLFHPSASAPLLWFAVSVLICTTGFSVVTINFQSLGGLWVTRPSDRTRVTATREAFGLVGLLVASVVPPVLTGIGGAEKAFHWLALGYLPLLALSFWLLLRWMRKAPVSAPVAGRPGTGWSALMRDRWRATFFALMSLNTFASAIPAVLVLFFIRDRLNAEAYTGLFLLIYFLAGVVSMPLWTRLARRSGKYRAWQISLLAAILTFFWAVFLQEGDLLAYGLVCALSGLALGADLALPPAILADHIAADERQGEASRLFAIMAFLSKTSLALATGLALPLLGAFGYEPNGGMNAGLALLLSLAYAGIPCGLKLAALLGLVVFEKDLALNRSAV